jgi:catechol 2,3-dioxygenase-like lactoylglutathione lyase family enzyme
MLGGHDLVAFVPTTHFERAKAFYGDVLGLPLVEQTEFACVFRARNATLRVTLVDRLEPAAHTVLGWAVPDLGAALADLAARGVQPARYAGLDQDERGVWRSPAGARIAWFRDPDGNVLSLTEE